MVLCPGLVNSMMTKSEGIMDSISYRTLLGKGIEQFTPQNPKEPGSFFVSRFGCDNGNFRNRTRKLADVTNYSYSSEQVGLH